MSENHPPVYEKIINHLTNEFKNNKSPSYGIHSVLFFIENDLTHGTGFLQKVAQRFEAPVTTLQAHHTFNFIKQMTALAEHNPKSVIVLPEIELLLNSEQAFLKEVLTNGKVPMYNDAKELKTYDFSQCVIIASHDVHAQKHLDMSLKHRFSFPVDLSDVAHQQKASASITPEDKKSASITHIDTIRQNAWQQEQTNQNKPKN